MQSSWSNWCTDVNNRAKTEQIPNITTLYRTELLIARNYLQFSVHNLHLIYNIYISIDNILIPLVPFQSFLKGGRKLSLAPSSYSTIFTDIPPSVRKNRRNLPTCESSCGHWILRNGYLKDRWALRAFFSLKKDLQRICARKNS